MVNELDFGCMPGHITEFNTTSEQVLNHLPVASGFKPFPNDTPALCRHDIYMPQLVNILFLAFFAFDKIC